MNKFGEIIRKLREEKELPLRTVAGYLDIDQAILSKMERGQRSINREQVLKLARFFNLDENELLVYWLSDKLVYQLADEELALKALRVAEQQVGYRVETNAGLATIIDTIKSVLENDGRVSAAWLLGSFARGEERPDSDIDIMIEFNNRKNYSMFDLLDIAYLIGHIVNRKVDIVEKGQLKNFAMKTAVNHLLKIYG